MKMLGCELNVGGGETRAQSHARGITGCGEMRRLDWMALAPLWMTKSALSC